MFGGTCSQLQNFSQATKRYRKITKGSDIEKLQLDMDRSGEWTVEILMKIKPGKSKPVSFTRARECVF